MSRRVLDSSAVLAWLLDEPGGDALEDGDGADLLCSVNLVEVITRLIDLGAPHDVATRQAAGAPCTVVPFTEADGVEAAALRPLTRDRGLSLGDRACLVLARRAAAPVLTADQAWKGLDLGIEIVLIR